jgi:Zn-dependent metalloprotease
VLLTGVTVFGIGIQKAVRIAIRANQPDIWGRSPNLTFLKARQDMVDAADRVFGVGSTEGNAVRRA